MAADADCRVFRRADSGIQCGEYGAGFLSMTVSKVRAGAFRTAAFGSQLVSASDDEICRPISLGLGVRIVGREQKNQRP